MRSHELSPSYSACRANGWCLTSPPQASDLPSLANTGGSGAAGFEPRATGRGVGSRQREEGLARPPARGPDAGLQVAGGGQCRLEAASAAVSASGRSGASCLHAVRPHFGRVNTDPELTGHPEALGPASVQDRSGASPFQGKPKFQILMWSILVSEGWKPIFFVFLTVR